MIDTQDTQPIANPFPGLRAFEEADEALFFGREKQAEEIFYRLLSKRCVAIVGTSGSGKSSLVRAGLLPPLRRGEIGRRGSKWRIAVCRPAGDPVGNLARALNQWNVPGAERSTDEDADEQDNYIDATLRQSGLGLVEAARLEGLSAHESVLILVDQFEELFRFAKEARSVSDEDNAAAFVKLLLEATHQTDLPIYVLLTMRSEFIGECARFIDLPEAVDRGLYLIPRMTREQRKQAITQPVAVAGGEIAPRLVNRVLNDVGDDPSQLPILQHALMRTWGWWADHRQQGQPLDLIDYQAIGTMRDALSKHANEAYEELDSQHREIAKRVFQALTEKEPDGLEVRRPTKVAQIVDCANANFSEVLAIIDVFRAPGRSFLTSSSEGDVNDDAVIDISHESLIRGWPLLKTWVAEEARYAEIYRDLARKAAQHRKGEADLLRGLELEIALDWRNKEKPRPAWANRYAAGFEDALAFLDTSTAAKAKEEAEKERLRSQRLRRTQAVVAVLVLLLIGVIGLWSYANAERRSAVAAVERLRIEVAASTEQALTNSGQLSAVAASMTDESPQLLGTFSRPQTALALSMRGNHKGAVEQFNEILNVAPGDLSARMNRSYEYLLTLQPEDSVADSEALVKANPQLSISHANLGLGLAMLEQYRRAADAVRQAIANYSPSQANGAFDSEVSPDIVAATGHPMLIVTSSDFILALWYELAVLKALEPQSVAAFEASLKQADDMAGKYPASASAYLLAANWAWYHSRVRPQDYGALAVSAALWERAARTDPTLEGWAADYFREFERIDSQRHDPRYHELALWVRSNMRGRLPRELTEWVRSVLPGSLPLGLRQRHLSARELEVLAEEQYSRIAPDDAIQVAEVDRYLTQAAELAQKDEKQRDLLVNLLDFRASALYGAGYKEATREDCERLLRLQPNDEVAYFYLAMTDWDDNIRKKHFEAALRYNPTDPALLEDFGLFLAKSPDQADKQRSLSILQTAISLWPFSARLYLEIAEDQEGLGQNVQALDSLKQAISIQPSNIILYERREQIEAKNGEDNRIARIHLAAGYRAAGDELWRLGKDGDALSAYMKSLEILAEFKMPNDDEAAFQSRITVRNLSDFLAARYSLARAQEFLENLALSKQMTALQAPVSAERGRLLAVGGSAHNYLRPPAPAADEEDSANRQ